MFGRRIGVWTLTSLLWIGLGAAGCGPPEVDGDAGDDTSGRPGDVADAGTEVGPDTAGDTTDPPDGGDAVDGTADTLADADAGDGDATDTTDGGRDADTGGESAAFVGLATDGQAGESTVYASVEPSTGSVDGSKTYATGDMYLAASSGAVFALDRRCSRAGQQEDCAIDQGIVRELAVGSGGQVSTAENYELPDGIYNPHGAGYVEVEGDLLVTPYATSEMYRYASAGTPEETRDLSPFEAGSTDSDMDPEPSDVSVHGDYVLVTLQRLSGFKARENSALAVLDTADGSFVDFDESTDGLQALDLGNTNAKPGTYRTPNDEWTVGFTGRYLDEDMSTALDGGVVRLDSSQPGDYSVGETVIDESDLGTNLYEYVMVGSDEGVAMIESGMATDVVRFSSDGTVETLEELDGFTEAVCLSPDGETVWVGAPAPEGQPAFIGYDTASWTRIDGARIEVDGSPSSCAFAN